jgi:hypothetical protein
MTNITKDEALDLAQYALKKARSRIVEAGGSGWKLEAQQCVNAITVIKQARSAPVQSAERGEPVAWMHWLNGPCRVLMDKDEAMVELDRLNREYPADSHARKMRPLVFGDTTPPAAPVQEPEEWDERCVLGHCGSPTGCELSNRCRADNTPAAQPAPEGMDEFLADLERSRTKYPKNGRMFDGLMGEVDELRRAYAGDGDVRAEAFDVAVCAYRIATEGDAGGNTLLATPPTAPVQPVQRLELVGTVKELFNSVAWEKLNVRGFSKVYLDADALRESMEPLQNTRPPAAQPAPKNDSAAKMPCGAVVANVYDAYAAGKKAAEQPTQLAQVVQAHIQDLRACLPTLREYQLSNIAVEIEKAANELEAAAAHPAPVQEPVAWMHWLDGPCRVLMDKDEAMMELDRLNREYPADSHARKMRPLVFGDTTPPAAQPAPVLSAGPITPEMANWSDADKTELSKVIAKHTQAAPVQGEDK